MVRSLIQRYACDHWRANAVFAAVAFVLSTTLIRTLAGIYFTLAPHDSYAAAVSCAVIQMSGPHFLLVGAIAALGGVTSFLHEVRHDPTKLRIINALGHLFAAQLAGLLMYLGALEMEWSVYWALFLCGLAGWGGNAAIQKMSDRYLPDFKPKDKP